VTFQQLPSGILFNASTTRFFWDLSDCGTGWVTRTGMSTERVYCDLKQTHFMATPPTSTPSGMQDFGSTIGICTLEKHTHKLQKHTHKISISRCIIHKNSTLKGPFTGARMCGRHYLLAFDLVHPTSPSMCKSLEAAVDHIFQIRLSIS